MAESRGGPADVPRSPGRQERRKARTREAVVEAAMELFAERGFDGVTVAEIAEAADVAPSTVFNHFPTKEGLVFHREPDLEAALVGAVHDRDPGTSVVEALHRHVRHFLDTRLAPASDGTADPAETRRVRRFFEISGSTAALRDHARSMWMRHEQTLTRALATEAGVEPTDPTVRALARLVMEAHTFVHRSDGDPRADVDAAFALLAHGWAAVDPALHPTARTPPPRGAQP